VNKFVLDKNDTILLIIDLQERLMNAMADREKVCKNAKLLLAAAETMGIPVVVSEQYPRGLGATLDIIREALKEYKYIEKVQFSVFMPELTEYLEKLKRKTVIVAGSETHVCVFQTVRDLVAAQYNVHVAKDAVCSRFEDNYLNGLELMQGAGAVISNTETIVFDLLKQAGTPEFKVLSPLIK